MPALTISLPETRRQRVFNLRRWEELLRDPEMRRLPGRIETDRFGRIIMSPPPAPNHGSFQLEIGHQLRVLIPHGRVLTECPISTADGVKAADVAWASAECMHRLGNRVCFMAAPEICVEVISPGNSEAEIKEKIALYFDSGAQEVWTCSESGVMEFFRAAAPVTQSEVCPAFPVKITLR